MEYIATRRARILAICGPVNIPWGTAVEAVDGFLVRDGLQLCAVTSQNAHDYFSRNDDGNGPERGHLVHAIMNKLAKRDKDYQKRWDHVWEDPVCQKYKQPDPVDFWLWDHSFFEAPVDDLRHIAALIGARG